MVSEPEGSALYSVPYLALGTQKYVSTSQTIDSLNQVINEEADSEIVSIAGVNEVEGQYSGLVCVEATSLSNNLGSEYTWYKATSDSLVEVAYSGSGQVPMVLAKKSEYYTPSLLEFSPVAVALCHEEAVVGQCPDSIRAAGGTSLSSDRRKRLGFIS